MLYGARVLYVDVDEDPDLHVEPSEAEAFYKACGVDPTIAQTLRDKLSGTVGSQLAEGAWYLDTLEQDGKRLRMYRETENKPNDPLDGLIVWRLVRCLEPGAVTIHLKRRDHQGAVTLNGWRRLYVDPRTGVLNGAFQPGEMLQSLCSPWQHDFRDCYCHYWAANHPDIVYGAAYPGDPIGGAADNSRSDLPLDWLRADRSLNMEAAADNTYPKNRPYQIDHYQVNREWRTLNVVIGDTEIEGPYAPDTLENANPYGDPAELESVLREDLAPLELTLALEYLYSRFSLLTPDEARRQELGTLSDDVTFARHYLLLIATSEMQHVRWVNQLLWDLYDAKLVRTYAPVFELARRVPRRDETHSEPQLRRLERDVVNDYIAVEHPSGLISGRYARVIATLRDTKTYPPHMVDLALRIANDGTQHERSFLDMRAVFDAYAHVDPPYPHLRKIRVADPGDAGPALDAIAKIIRDLKQAYADGAQGDFSAAGRLVVNARTAMNDLLDIGEKMALNGLGIPFFAQWPKQ
jgi:hypothetical protein